MVNKSNKQGGFGLIEVIISIAVIGVMLIGIHGITLSSLKNDKNAQIDQKAAMYGQQIFEDFKSSEVTKTINADKSKLELSNGLKLTNDNSGIYSVELPFENNIYKADITVNKNNSNMGTALNKQISDKTINEGDKVEVDLTKVGKKVSMDGKSITEDYDKSNPLTLIVSININKKHDGTTEKEIKIQSKDMKEPFIQTFECNSEADEKKAVYLIFNLEDYKLEENSTENIKLQISNEDKNDVNIIAKNKSENLLMSLEQWGSGEFKFYDENSNLDLYDVEVTVKRDGKEIFKQKSSQNIKVVKAGGE